MNAIMDNLKPAMALAASAMLGALLVLSAVAMLGNSAHTQTSLDAPKVLVGISRFNTTDIRVAP